MAYVKNKKSRQLTYTQMETRRRNATKRKILNICKELEILLYTKEVDDDYLIEFPDYFRCVFPTTDACFGAIYYPDADADSMYVSKHDFELIKGRIR